jgi:hypothetical protein
MTVRQRHNMWNDERFHAYYYDGHHVCGYDDGSPNWGWVDYGNACRNFNMVGNDIFVYVQWYLDAGVGTNVVCEWHLRDQG